MEGEKIKRILVIGCGSIGRRHIGNLLSLKAGVVMGCDPEEARRGETEARFGIKCFGGLEEAWKESPSAVVVAVPTHLHVAVGLEAVGQGCDLLIEKPLGDGLEGTEELLKRVNEAGVVTLVGCNMRFHPGLRRVKRLIEGGAVGRICAARVEVGQYLPDWHPEEDYRQGYSAQKSKGGGVILDAIHEIDYVRWMVGEVEAVSCLAGRLSGLEIDTEDTAGMLLRFESGVIGEVHLDYVQRAYRRTCQIIGAEGTILWDYSLGQVTMYLAKTGQWETFKDPAGWKPNDMYVEEMSHFLNCLEGREKPEQDVFEGRRVLEIALAAKESSLSGRTVELGGRGGA